MLAAYNLAFLAVVDEGRFQGVFYARTLLMLADGHSPDTSIAGYVESWETISTAATGAEALRQISASEASFLAVVTPDGFYAGMVGVASLTSDRVVRPELGPIGGMATPLGVYLTDGVHRAGPAPWGLLMTGAGLFLLLSLCNAATIPLVDKLANSTVNPNLADAIVGILVIVMFLTGMRLLPISGTHAAEHMVVNALERGEPLTLPAVRRMPRVHPRCGTNFAAAAMLFGTIYGVDWGAPEEVRLVLGLLAAAFFWRSFGAFLQTVFTTRPPTDKQILGAIGTGEELLANVVKHPGKIATPWHRIWNSGILFVMAGSLVMVGLVTLIAKFVPEANILLR